METLSAAFAEVQAQERALWKGAEAQWDAMLDRYDHFTVLVLGTFLLHEFVYFTRYIPFWICDRIPALRKYKIQTDKVTTNAMIGKVLLGLTFTHLFVQVPIMISFHYAAELIGMAMYSPFPPLWKILMQTVIFLIIEDFWEYWAHRLLHWGWLYKVIHKQHHEFPAPFGIVGEYAHPVEILFLGFGTGLGPLLFARDLHLVSLWFYMAARLWQLGKPVRGAQVVDAHSGYDFPWSLHNFLPFWAGADFHDHHHMAFTGNYGTSFRWCDWLFGTDTAYRTWKAASAAKTGGPAAPNSGSRKPKIH